MLHGILKTGLSFFPHSIRYIAMYNSCCFAFISRWIDSEGSINIGNFFLSGFCWLTWLKPEAVSADQMYCNRHKHMPKSSHRIPYSKSFFNPNGFEMRKRKSKLIEINLFHSLSCLLVLCLWELSWAYKKKIRFGFYLKKKKVHLMFSGLHFDCVSSTRASARPPAHIMNMDWFHKKNPLKAFHCSPAHILYLSPLSCLPCVLRACWGFCFHRSKKKNEYFSFHYEKIMCAHTCIHFCEIHFLSRFFKLNHKPFFFFLSRSSFSFVILKATQTT